MYGENTGHLRDALGVLLREHRIQQRLGGKGTYTVPQTTTETERADLGRQIRRYRHGVLTWCLQATTTASGAADRRAHPGGTTGRGPVDDLHRRLTETLAGSTTGLAPIEELTTHQQFATVESWRQAARAAALGELDLTTSLAHGRLSSGEAATVLRDAVDIVRGLVVLDRRYDNVPGWEKLHQQGWLAHAANILATHPGLADPDYTVDRRGWSTGATDRTVAPLPGLAGVTQAQAKVLAGLADHPDAHSLRVILAAQRVISAETAARVGDADPRLAAKWTQRAHAYQALVRQTRDLGGLVGHGTAAGDASVAASRADRLPHEPLTDSAELQQLDVLFTRIDEAIAGALERGAIKRLYFQRVPLPRIDDQAPGPVKAQRHRYTPITALVRKDLLDIASTQLRHPAIQQRAPQDAGQRRADFEAAITHRPGDPGLALSM